ncbi:MAG: tRNA pseudouridine(13) synthase TruD [Thermoplasmata archaeon]
MQETTSEVEKGIGLEVFFTDTKGIGGKLKNEPEDFIVDEIPILPAPANEGKYIIATVKSRNWETNRLIRHLARTLRISRKRIHFAGTKDKRAVTTQLMAFDGVDKETIEKLKISDIEISNVYTSNKSLDMGDLIGNNFYIVVRDIQLSDVEINKIVNDDLECISKLGGFPNFFGIQRFGAVRPITHHLGKFIVHGDFEKAVFAYAANPLPWENEESHSARAFLEKTRDFKQALKIYPKQLSFELTMIHYLASNPNDFVGALKQLPKNLLMMFVHAYQAYLFNKILSERIRRQLPLNEPQIGDVILPIDKNKLPNHDVWIDVNDTNIDKIKKAVAEQKAFVSGLVFGSETKFANNEQGEIERKIIEKEGLKPNDFIIPKIPEISSSGIRRELLAQLKVSDISLEVSDKTLRLKFQLLKGCYATSLLREFMKADVMSY